MGRPLHIVFAAPAYWPATQFGGPIPVMRALAGELSGLGHRVDVVTTTLTSVRDRPARRSSTAELDGATVQYLGTPLRYRWFGVTPTLQRQLTALPRPDVVHVFGFRDYVSTVTARWCRRHGVPYVLEPLGMFRPKLRKVLLKRTLDDTLYRAVPRGAALAIAASEVERRELSAVLTPDRIAVRPNGFPPPQEPAARPGRLRRRLGLGPDEPLVLSVGRIARGKGLEQLVAAVSRLDGVQLAVVGPDDGHGLSSELVRLRDRLGSADRVHLLGPVDSALDLYGDADVFALASAHENFGMVAAEAAAAGTAGVITNRCGVAELLRDRGALVIDYDEGSLHAALARLLADNSLREELGRGGRAAAAELSWSNVARLQAEIYERIA
jgi:glycosyltransferase involved in cell wall biosynthesis